jgi:hypothetical protein
MRTWINVCRYHLIDRFTFTVVPCAMLAFIFGVNLAVTAATPSGAGGRSALQDSLFGFYGGYGALWGLTARSLPFGLALGVSRRSYYTGTALLSLGLAAGYGLALAVLQAVEGATGGWGLGMHLFRMPHALAGPWALTWLTSSVALTLISAYGLWGGIVYRRWNHIGLLIFVGALITVLLSAVLIIVWTRNGPHIAHALARLTPTGLTGLLALLVAAVLASGYATIRHTTV